MVVLALSPGHDGAIAAARDGTLLFAYEAEKDSFERHAALTVTTFINAVERLGEMPDVVAYSGAVKTFGLDATFEGLGYFGSSRTEQRPMNFLGKQATLFSSTHERAHIMSAIGMAPRDDSPERAVLVWEGGIGSLYLVDSDFRVKREFPIMYGPGVRYAALFAVADPTFDDRPKPPRDDAGKLMALAAFGDAADADAAITDVVDRIITGPPPWPLEKAQYKDTPLYNAEVTAQATKTAAALLTERMFQIFSEAAMENLPPGLPLHIAGGCGLNCDWNMMWRELGHFSSVFVPPCPNDSGLAVGSITDALAVMTGEPYIDWNVYCGLEFEWDSSPDPQVWQRREFSEAAIADAIAGGRVFAWVQGRAELGPRALGNRSLLANPFDARTRDRLNDIKLRETYRPVAPCCRLEDVGKVYDRDFPDPYMLYFRKATTRDLAAVTHVDDSARCQTVTREANKQLHDLLTAFGERHGVGVLCNTSLNFKERGFINRMSDLTRFCETRGVDDFVVGDAWFQRA
jgi:hydroxymethyl cephem carbamoyltransferase